MNRSADLHHCDRMAVEILVGFEASVVSAIGNDESVLLEAGRIAHRAGDDLWRARGGEAVKGAVHSGDAKIEITGSDPRRDRLRRVESDDLGVDVFSGEIAFVDGNVERRGRG